MQLYGLDRLRIRPAFEQPRLHGPDRRLDLQVGSAERALGSVVGHEDVGVGPSAAKGHWALLRLGRGGSAPFAHMRGLRHFVEDESDRSVELSCYEDVELVREFDVCRSVPTRGHCCSPVVVALGGSRPSGPGAHSTSARTWPATRATAADARAPGCTAGDAPAPGTSPVPPR